MVIAVNNIESLNWSPKLGSFGEIVENVEDIEQCIKIILTTPRGSDPHRPTFASGIFNYIDYPQTAIKQYLIRETYESLLTWEPRINIDGVKILFNQQQLGSIDIEIAWSVKDSSLQTITIVNIS
jgi:phage baseplate assembly protein W